MFVCHLRVSNNKYNTSKNNPKALLNRYKKKSQLTGSTVFGLSLDDGFLVTASLLVAEEVLIREATFPEGVLVLLSVELSLPCLECILEITFYMQGKTSREKVKAKY